MKFVNKQILIISPQKWEGLFVSKHHYAVELSKKENTVYFLGPPEKGVKFTIKNTEYNNLFVVEHNHFYNKKIRFHIRWLFDLLTKKYVKLLSKSIGKIDIVWCFEPNLYKNLNWFNAAYKIFHPVDIIDKREQFMVGNSADIIFSVAGNILNKFKGINTPKFFVNHGLSESFCNNENVDSFPKVRFAYIGNLMIHGLDRLRIKEIVLQNPSVNFDFYGNFSTVLKDDFITFLDSNPNTYLKGTKTTFELAKLLLNYSGFIICYNLIMESNSGSNSHKILE